MPTVRERLEAERKAGKSSPPPARTVRGKIADSSAKKSLNTYQMKKLSRLDADPNAPTSRKMTYSELQQVGRHFKQAVDTFKPTGKKIATIVKDTANEAIAKGNARQAAEKAAQDKWDAEHGRNIPVLGSVLRGLDKVAKTTKPASDIALEYYTPGAGLSALGAASRGAEALVSKIAPGLGEKIVQEGAKATFKQSAKALGGKVAKTALREGIVGAPLGVGNQLARDPQSTNSQLLEAGAYGAGGGALLGGAGTLIKGGVQKGAQTVREALANTVGKQMEAVDSVARADLPQTVRRVASKDSIPELFPERFQRTVSGAKPPEPVINPAPVETPKTVRATLEAQQAQQPVQTVRAKLEGQQQQPIELTADNPKVLLNPTAETVPTELPQQVEPPQTVRAKLQSEQKMRGFTETLLESDKTAPELKQRLQSPYHELPNQVVVDLANKRVAKDVESAASYVLGKSAMSAEKVTTAHRLIDEFSKQGNFERANDIADKIAEELTKAGQTVQAASIYNRLTPEGVLVHAHRVASRINEKLPVWQKEVKITPEMSEQIVDLASTTQKMTGVKSLAADVLDIVERAKAGEKLSTGETDILKRFIDDTKQFVKETTRKPKTPRPPKLDSSPKVREKVVSFLDAQEQAAKERLRARGIRVSSTPLDVWADYAIIGAAKMAKGSIKFADWSEQMVRDLGEEIRPHLESLYERSTQAFEHGRKQVSDRQLTASQRLVERIIEGKNIAPEQAESLREVALKVANLSGQAKNQANQDLQFILQGLEKPTLLRQVSTAQTLAQLLNPKTLARNLVGNEMFYRVERLNKYLATPIDIARSKLTGGPRTVTFRTHNQGKFWENWLIGAKAGWRGVSPNGVITQYELGSGLAFRSKLNPLHYLEKILGASLRSFDYAAYMRGVNKTLGEMATLKAINEGQKPTKELIQRYAMKADDNIAKIADEYGRYITFQDNNVFSVGLQKAKRFMNAGKEFGFGDLIIKYPKTPGSLLMRALEYSPAGFFRSAWLMFKPLVKQQSSTKEITESVTRAIIGTAGFTGLGYFMFDKGLITGAASKDRDIRELQRAAGQGQYQLNISAMKRWVHSGFDPDATKIHEDDFLYTYDWAQPLAMSLSLGANIRKNQGEGNSTLTGVPGMLFDTADGSLNSLTEQSVLRGIKDLATGYPGQTPMDKIVDILSDMPASFVPTLFNQIRQVTDNTKRETYDISKLDQAKNKALNRIPGYASKLPPQFDTLGQQKENYQSNNPFNVFLNPGFTSRYKLSPEAEFIVDLIAETGDETLAPRVPGKSITVDGMSIKLDGNMFSRIQQLQGEETRTQLQKRIKSDVGKKLETRTNNVSKSLTKAGENARDQLRKEMGLKK